MIIKNSAIQLNSQHQFLKSYQESESLRIWKTEVQPPADSLSLSESAQTLKTEKQSFTPFQLRTADNKSLGEVTDTGVYLTEDGKVETLQQINLSA